MVSMDAPEGLVHTELNTTLHFGDRDRGKGTLYITEYYMLWKGTNENDTLTLEYPSISLHAISRDTGSFPHECLYCLLESADVVSEDERDPEAEVSEVRFVPENEDNIKAMYDAVTHCQELHPDAEDEDSEEEQDLTTFLQHGQFYTADTLPNEVHLSEEGQAVLQRLQISIQGGGDAEMPMNGVHSNGSTDQFQDADDEMDD